MADDENMPTNDIINKTTTAADDVSDAVKIVIGNEKNTHPALMGPLVIRVSNVPESTPVTVHRSLDVSRRSDGESQSISQDSKLDQADLDEAASIYEDCDLEDDDGDGYDFDYGDEDDDDLSLECDPFFGDAQTKPDRPTEEQLEAIRKIMEEDEQKEAEKEALEEANREAIQKALTEALPPALVDNSTGLEDFEPIEPPHPLLSEQVNNATELVLRLRSFLGGEELMLVVGYIEPLFEMKLKFIQAVNLEVTELENLAFLFGEYYIQDEDTAYKLGMGNGANIYCERIGAMPNDAISGPSTS
ncbi:unnamed protein product [Aureobasidium uvarum]|uniref:Uncharacterized protein n=1 Tax=Aureobasidium uvarum TaxID=2773716 RepID=A0A9N8KEE3_9PEZI|nr:unnamed protein product [Aureobasidium uvarum]